MPAKLSWTHIITLLGVSDTTARKFYEAQCLRDNWGYRELERQIDSSLFERLALSRDKKEILTLAEKGHIITNPEDLTKDPYILDFLQIPQAHKVILNRRL